MEHTFHLQPQPPTLTIQRRSLLQAIHPLQPPSKRPRLLFLKSKIGNSVHIKQYGPPICINEKNDEVVLPVAGKRQMTMKQQQHQVIMAMMTTTMRHPVYKVVVPHSQQPQRKDALLKDTVSRANNATSISREIVILDATTCPNT